MYRKAALTLLITAGLSSAAAAAPTPIGVGVDQVGVVLNFSDGFILDYALDYGASPSDTIGGATATADVSSTYLPVDNTTPATPNPLGDQNLSLQWTVYSFGDLLQEATYTGGHTDTDTYVYGDPSTYEDYWHEWTNDGTGWSFVEDTDTISSGDSVGWVFGSDNAPAVPEPATGGTVAVAAAGALGARRRRRP
jgi:hypothetical protein